MFRRKRWAVVGALTTALVVIGDAAAAATNWTAVTPPSPSNTLLNGVFARAANDVWAVGTQFAAAGQTPQPPVTYHWDGVTWTRYTTPALGVNAALTAVSKSTDGDVWAVGSIAAPGYRRRVALYEHWNGTGWTPVQDPTVGGLNGVITLSKDNAWAVGALGAVVHWNGSAWTPVTVPNPNPANTFGNNLTAITAVNAGDIWAVGKFTDTSYTTSAYALHYIGGAWTVASMEQPSVSGPNSPILHAVTAVASDNIWAVGENQEVPGLGLSTLVERWNGTAWKIVSSPTYGAYPALNGVAATPAGDVYAVGFNQPSINGGTQQGLLMHYTGGTWSQESTRLPAGTFSSLYGVTAAPGGEWAVGVNGSSQALVLRGS